MSARRRSRILLSFALSLFAFLGVLSTLPFQEAQAVNPYLPLWEHIPDEDPHIFEDPDNPGKYRIYLYGSHDITVTAYCGIDVVVWSAPLENPTEWRYDGPAFVSKVYNTNGRYDTMYAPCICEVYFGQKYIDYMNAHPEFIADVNNPGKVLTMEEDGGRWYYMYPHNRGRNRMNQLARSRRPDGPFVEINMDPENPTQGMGVMGFDPCLFFEEDPTSEWGFRAYAYWGGGNASYACELYPDLYTAIPGTLRGGTGEDGFVPGGESTSGEHGGFNFYEASVLKKIEIDGVKKYLFIWAGRSGAEYGLEPAFGTKRYAYSDHPLGPWICGGVIVDARGPALDQDGKMIYTYSHRNTHGNIQEINGQWYVFFHRVTNDNPYARQSMVEPINVEITPQGDVLITGLTTLTDVNGNHYKGAEVTSQGWEINGLDPYKYYSAGYACWVTPAALMLPGVGATPGNRPYVAGAWDVWNNDNPIVNIRDSSIVGYKYFNFTKESGTKLDLYLTPAGQDFTIDIMMDTPWPAGTANAGVKIGELKVSRDAVQQKTRFTVPVPALDEVEGKHAIFFVFRSENADAVLCEMNGLAFSTAGKQVVPPAEPPVLSIWADGKPLTLPATPIRTPNTWGVTDYTHYMIEYEHSGESIPKIAASASDPDVKITITQATSPSGTAVVRFIKDGLIKNYHILFSYPDRPNTTGLVPSSAFSPVSKLVRGEPARVPVYINGADLEGFFVKLLGKTARIVDGEALLQFSADEIPAVGTYKITVVNEDGHYILGAGNVDVITGSAR